MMQNDHTNPGDLLNVYSPSSARMLITGLICAGLLVGAMLGALLTFDALTHNDGRIGSAAGPLVSLGASSLLLALIGSFLVTDFRKWKATRTVRLTIFQRGLTYESHGQRETCRWDEIKNINYRVIEIRSKHSLPSKVRVVRSIQKHDDKLIEFAETLDLIKITRQITALRKDGGVA